MNFDIIYVFKFISQGEAVPAALVKVGEHLSSGIVSAIKHTIRSRQIRRESKHFEIQN